MTAFNIDFTLTRANLKAYLQLISLRLNKIAGRGSAWKHPWFGFVAIIALGLITAILLEVLFNRMANHQLDGLSLFLGSWIGILGVYGYGKFRRRGYEMAMYPDGSSSLSRKTGIIDEAGLKLSGAHFDALYHWPLISELTEHSGLIILWIDNAQGIMLPRSAFGDEATAQAFIAFARAQIAKAKTSASAV